MSRVAVRVLSAALLLLGSVLAAPATPVQAEVARQDPAAREHAAVSREGEAAVPPQEAAGGAHAGVPAVREAARRGQEPDPVAGAEHGARQEAEHGALQEAEHGAPGEGEHAAAEHHGPTWTQVAFRWLNFGLLVALLYWLLVTPPAFVVENFEFPGLRVVLAQRARGIVEARDLAQRQRQEAEAALRGSERRLARVEQEVAALLQEAREGAAAERERLRAAAVAEAERIRQHAGRELSAQVAAARRELQQHVADLATRIARSLLERDLRDSDQERLVRGYLDRLSHTVG